MLISHDAHVWPPWAPEWLRAQVESPDCSGGTHPCLRKLVKWLVIIFSGHEGEAERWLCHAAARCDREVDDGEIVRLLAWAEARFTAAGGGKTFSTKSKTFSTNQTPDEAKQLAVALPDLEEIYRIAASGPRLEQYRASSPVRLDLGTRCTDQVLRQWALYAGGGDPWVCFGSYNRFWTRRLSACGERLFRHEQIVPSPMRAQRGLTAQGRLSEHSLAACGERTFLCIEFDFAPLTPRGKPTIWAPLLERCGGAGISVLDMNAALIAHLGAERPVWMTVFSGGKSLQMWTPCRGESDDDLHNWFVKGARRLGACNSTWCKSQFVRMPDGTRAAKNGGVRQSIEFYNPGVL